ncbi:MAG: hypothetical protein P9M08_09610 [Candidatus Erginobacter occultus]|nr:hypothetical protein [Candidatus Erginobacter occultus]
MSRSVPAILPVLAFLGALAVLLPPAGRPADFRLFFDDFSGDLADRWIPFSFPGPRITRVRGNPPPGLDNGSAANRRGGVISKRLFQLEPGLILKADILISGGGGDAVFGGSLGLPRDPEAFIRGRWPEWLVGMSYDYIGRTDWSRGAIPEGGILTCSLIDEDGGLEISRRPYLTRWLGSWHNFEITILQSGFVEFRLDGELVYYSRKRISFGYSQLPLLLGHLSGKGGKVYHDNAEVRAGRIPSGPGAGPGE